MATTKVGVYRKYHGPIPKDKAGKPLPKSEWPKKRGFSWAVRWHGRDGKRYSKSFRTRKEAERYAEEKQQEVRQGKADPPPEITLQKYHEEHKKLMRGNVARTTLVMQLTAIEYLAAHVGWQKSVATVTVRDIEALRAKRLQEGVAASTANKEIKLLRRIFNLAIQRGYLLQGSNPCVGLPMLKVAPKRPPYVSPEEFEAICRSTPDLLFQVTLVTMYTTGLRKREVENLTWADIDFETGQVHVTRKQAGGFVQAWTPKDHEMRSVPLPEQTVSLLTAWQANAPEACPYAFMDHGRWEFYRAKVEAGTWRSGQDLINNVLRRYKTCCRRAGVGPYTIHDLRRSCITNWAKALPIHVVQQLAGHSDIKTTQQFYLSVGQEDIAKAQAVQQQMVQGIPTVDPTDPKLTHSGKMRRFPGQQGCPTKRKALD